MKTQYKKAKLFCHDRLNILLLLLVLSGSIKFVSAQCPANIDFETGTFSGWTCYTGGVTAIGGINNISLNPVPGPVSGRHAMLSSVPGNGIDQYGGFPQNCPNGSGHSVKIGNNIGGHEAEGVSYTFTIPATANKFSLIYYYAVVFQDPGHSAEQQPRLQIEIRNVTDNTTLDCSNFIFVANGSIPGFYLSTAPGSNIPVWCKNWSANTINLDGNQGKTIRVFFKTADCTFIDHFGYAYVDVNTECGSSFVGSKFCPNDTAIDVSAPFGYQKYTWYNNNFTQVLGTQQTLHISPAPPSGTTVSVILEPFNGYGCPDTLTAELLDTLTVKAFAGRDTSICTNTPYQLGSPPIAGLVYKWSPSVGLSNPNIANPVATLSNPATYILTASSAGGGCISADTVTINTAALNDNLQLIGSASYCTSTGLSTVLQVFPADSIQWYMNGIAMAGANQTTLNVNQSGDYYARLFNFSGCIKNTRVQNVNIYESPVAGFTINKTNQCLKNNQFIFTNTSTIPATAVKYTWYLGDGNTDTTKDLIYSYTQPGNYTVKLVVTAPGSCADSISFTITVYPYVAADFLISPVCIDLRVPIINKTKSFPGTLASYFWEFGNGDISIDHSPVYSYQAPGNYIIKLTVSTAQCLPETSSMQKIVTIDAPVPSVNYPVKNAISYFPEMLQARNIGNSVLWLPGTSLDNRISYHPVFKGLNDQLYTIQLKTNSGCLTVDTQLVKTRKNIRIYVPTVFTPGTDGKNDLLRPLLMSFVKVNYFRIFNRWGKLLFEMKSDGPGWDGRVKGQPAELQTVIWMIEAVDVDGIVHKKQGTTVLMR